MLTGTLIRQRDADWAVLPGGGVDVRWTDSLAVRFQIDAPVERSEARTAKSARASVWLTFHRLVPSVGRPVGRVGPPKSVPSINQAHLRWPCDPAPALARMRSPPRSAWAIVITTNDTPRITAEIGVGSIRLRDRAAMSIGVVIRNEDHHALGFGHR